MGFFDLFKEGAVAPLIIKRVDEIRLVQFADFSPLPGTPEEELVIEVNVAALSASKKQEFKNVLLSTFDEKKWKRYTIASATIHRSQMNNSFLVQFGGSSLVYDMDLASKEIIKKMLMNM